MSRRGRTLGRPPIACSVAVLILAALAAPLAAQQPVRAVLGSESSMPVPTFRIIPTFTAGSSASAQGAVELEVVVDSMGRVAHARVVTHLAEAYDRASLEAIRRWRFRPAVRDKTPIAVLIGVRFMFLPPRTAGAAPEVSAQLGLLPRQPLPSEGPPEGGRSGGAGPPGGGRSDTAVRPVRTITPEYTDAALRRKIQGEVEVDVTIRPDGSVASARVVRSLDAVHGLDEQALIAARYWSFEPVRLDGMPVAATSRLILTFRLY